MMGKMVYFLKQQNVNQLVEKIKYVLNHPKEAKILGENLYLKVKEYSSSEKYYDTLQKFMII